MRNYSNKIVEISKKTKSGYPIPLRAALANSILRLRTAVTKAIEYRKNQEELQLHERTRELAKDIENGPCHVFGEHAGCGERAYFCTGPKDGEVNLVPEMKGCGMWEEVMRVVRSCLFRHASSLIYDVDNNASEQYNSVTNKFLGGRRIFFAARGSYKARCEASVVSFNTGQYLRVIHKTLLDDNSPGKLFINHIYVYGTNTCTYLLS